MLPYDGSPGGNALGMQHDEERRASYEAATALSLSHGEDGSDSDERIPIQTISYVVFIVVFVAVILYGTVG